MRDARRQVPAGRRPQKGQGEGREPHPSVASWFTRPVIPVLWQGPRQEDLANASLVFLQGCELADLPTLLSEFSTPALARLPVLVHIDLLAGLASDEAGLRHLSTLKRITGIITVRPHIIAAARRMGFASVLLLFLQDGRAVERGLHVAEQTRPDAIELVPGVAALEMAREFSQLSIPRIAGGLIRTPELAQQLLASGYSAVSTSDPALWAMNGKMRPRT